jgi:hypothetical protein
MYFCYIGVYKYRLYRYKGCFFYLPTTTYNPIQAYIGGDGIIITMMSPILTPEMMERELRVSYPTFLKIWCTRITNNIDGTGLEETCSEDDKLHNGDHSFFDGRLLPRMRADFTTYIKQCNYQFSAKDRRAEKKAIATIRTEFVKFYQQCEIERANERPKLEAQGILKPLVDVKK